MGKRAEPAASRPRRGKKYLREQRRRQKSRRRWLTYGGVAVGALLLAAYAFWPRASAPEVSSARLADNPSRGPEDAPVTIVEYGDFGCPACRAWHQSGIIEQLFDRYGDQVRFEWRDLPIITPQSPKAAEAAQCAYDQGIFWEYHDLLFDRAPRLGVRDLKEYAAQVGLDRTAFDRCLDSGQHKATVDQDLREAVRQGFRGTPSFTVNGQPLVGPNPDLMVQLIDIQLALRGESQ